MRACLRERGIAVAPEAWTSHNAHYQWLTRFVAAADAIKAVIPPGSRYVLIDDACWGDHWAGSPVLSERHHRPFLERDGEYWGPPPDDTTALRELERMQQQGASFVVIGWPSFWWLNQ